MCLHPSALNERGAEILHTNRTFQIKSLETRARDVLRLIPSLQNLLRPANRLPPEVLSHITRCLLQRNNALDTRQVIPLTQVCRYWRESIISVPANWTLICNLRKGLTALTLQRVKAASLKVHLDADPRDLGSFDLLAPYAQNINTLWIMGPTTIEKLRRVLPDFPRSTPNLRSLSLNFVHRDQSIDPFESLASTLEYLEFFDIPLYPSILRLRSLTEFAYFAYEFDLHLDTLLEFLEENHMLERVTLDVSFKEASLRSSRRQITIGNRLRYLSIYCRGNSQVIISRIALQRGAQLDIITYSSGQLNDILSGVSTTHLSNLPSPIFIKYRTCPRSIRLSGPNGKFSTQSPFILTEVPTFVEFPLLPLTPLVFDQSPFPALEILVVNCETSISHLLSALFSNPPSPPLLKTLAFIGCNLTEDFMEELTQYASKRKDTTSAWLYKVVITHPDGVFPSISAIRKLTEHVSVVDVRIGAKLPGDLS